MKQSKGAIAVDSAPGKGTTITLYIPLACNVDEPIDDEDTAGQVVRPGLKVLLVEDDAEVRSVVRTFLVLLGCEVSTAASAEQALLELGPTADFHLLLTDIALGQGIARHATGDHKPYSRAWRSC